MTDPRLIGTLINIEMAMQRGAKALVKMATLLESLARDREDSRLRDSPVGHEGRVTSTGGIWPNRLGEVLVDMPAGAQAYVAKDVDNGLIEPETAVVVVDQVSARTVLVTRMYPKEGEVK